MAEKVKDMANEIVNEDFEKMKKYTTDAARSGAYLYPFKGIYFFLTHKSLQKPLIAQLTPTLTTSVAVTTFMFAVAYLPQAALMALFSGPLGAVSAFTLVLSESSTISNLLARTFFIGEALTDIFDGTLVARNAIDTVTEGRELKPGSDAIGRLGKLVKKPFQGFTPRAIIRRLLYMPLNVIPLLGNVVYVVLQGKQTGPAAHARYFQLRDFNARQREEFVHENRAAYTSFGIPALLLEMIPFVGILFAFTNACGAALWAADMENARISTSRSQLSESSSSERNSERKKEL